MQQSCSSLKARHSSRVRPLKIAATSRAFAEGCVATVQNGLGNEEAIAGHVGCVIRGTTFPAGKLLEPGHVQWDVKGDTTLGPFDDRVPLAVIERLADACTRAGMPAKAVEDARGPQWRKVIFNASTNPIGALTGLTHGRVCERPDLRARARRLLGQSDVAVSIPDLIHAGLLCEESLRILAGLAPHSAGSEAGTPNAVSTSG